MKYILSISLLFSLSCCTTLKRYRNISSVSKVDIEKVSIDLFGTKIEPAKVEDKSQSLWDLDAEGQAELIKELAKKNVDEEKFILALGKDYFKKKEKAKVDYTSKDLRLVFSISRKRDYAKLIEQNSIFNFGDRIEYIKFDIIIPETTNLKFVKWNKFSTEYADIEIADLSFNQTLEINASTGISKSKQSENSANDNNATSSNSINPSLSASLSANKTEAQKIRYRYVTLNGKISDKQVSIEQEGRREIDLCGNVIADINLKFDENIETLTRIEGYKTNEGKYNTPDKMKLELFSVIVPNLNGLPEIIQATLKYEYLYRHIKKGSKTYFEWDDVVEYQYGDTSKNITLFKKKDYIPAFYNINVIGEDKLNSVQRTKILLEDLNSKDTSEIVFQSLEEARSFLNWLIKFDSLKSETQNPIKIDNHKLLIVSKCDSKELTPEHLSTIKSKLMVLPYYR